METKPNIGSRRRLALIGAPTDRGAGQLGAALGPAALRDAGIADFLSCAGFDIFDVGDASPDGRSSAITLSGWARNSSAVARWVHSLAKSAYEALRRDDTPIFLGGDHALSIGSLAGVSRHWADAGRELFVIWLDAHADLNTPSTTPTGNLHGMALAALTGEQCLSPLLEGTGHVPIDPRRVLLVGTRSVDGPEARTLAMRSFNVSDIDQLRGHQALDPLHAFLERIADARGVLHLSFDIDVLDPAIAPGVGTPVAGGLEHDEVLAIVRVLRQSGLVRSLDIAELNPLLDLNGCTAALAARLAASVFANLSAVYPHARAWELRKDPSHGRHAE